MDEINWAPLSQPITPNQVLRAAWNNQADGQARRSRSGLRANMLSGEQRAAERAAVVFAEQLARDLGATDEQIQAEREDWEDSLGD